MLARPNRLALRAEYKAVVRRGRRCAGAHTVTYLITRRGRRPGAFRFHREPTGRRRRRTQHRAPAAQGRSAPSRSPTVAGGSGGRDPRTPECRDCSGRRAARRRRSAAWRRQPHERPSRIRTRRCAVGGIRSAALCPAAPRGTPLSPTSRGTARPSRIRTATSASTTRRCSAYAVGAVQQHGAVKGAALTARAPRPLPPVGRRRRRRRRRAIALPARPDPDTASSYRSPLERTDPPHGSLLASLTAAPAR